ncbi:DEAD/DEAH box helicase [uncultured Thiodictyon sp.]|uniref:DEAD/DEAH box helicase n=1 Tax=uncultured Thiodictyon sp. TaxID=1846217 RepID=UPI0025D02759|nr:DEAD/DEAH box helicase [uncultured Thiodictyon sp.]
MLELYPHQATCIDELREGIRQGHKRQVLGLATGGGKTVVASHIAVGAVAKSKRVLFIVDRIELVSQAARTFHAMGLRVGILQGEFTSYSPEDDIIVASIQTIAKRSAPDWVQLIIIDECHILHGAHIKLMESWNALPFIGLSATPLRKGLGKYFTNLVRGPSVRELTERGFLVPVNAFAPGADHISAILADVSAGTTTHGYDYTESALGDAMNRKELVGDIVATWKKNGENRPTLCFAVNIAHSKAIAAEFEADGVAVAHIDAYTKRDERKRMIAGFRDGSIKILSSVNVLGIGFDVPDAACLILARPTLSESLHMQQMGRGIRTAPGKNDCIILDHAANTLKHGLPIHFEVPDLDDGKGDERGTRKAKEKPKFIACSECGGVMEPGQFTCPSCGIDRPRRASTVQTVDGELVAFGNRDADERADKLNWYLAMLWTVRNSSNPKDGIAYHLFMAKFKGEKPAWAWKDLTPVQPTPEQARWIRGEQQRRRIAWIKSRAA